jgi:hypothetical protein
MKTHLQDVNNPICNVRLELEELESVIAPAYDYWTRPNHNDTFLAPPAVLEAEELEAVIAPYYTYNTRPNHNDTLLAA